MPFMVLVMVHVGKHNASVITHEVFDTVSDSLTFAEDKINYYKTLSFLQDKKTVVPKVFVVDLLTTEQFRECYRHDT